MLAGSGAVAQQAAALLDRAGVSLGDSGAPAPAVAKGGEPLRGKERAFAARSPIDGSVLASLGETSAADLDDVIARSAAAFRALAEVPAPLRGEAVRRFGDHLSRQKETLAGLICLESGKTLSEARAEVQEGIDVCAFATGLSRQLHGLTMGSERPSHRLMEQWHPLGPVAVISAFNFPLAVWAWNAALAWVCGNPVIWKPSEKGSLTALAAQAVMQAAIAEVPGFPSDASCVVLGGAETALALVRDRRVALVSATGSTEMGRVVARETAARLGRSLLELGGNNALVVAPSADIDLTVQAIAFSATATAGQRCTSLRRLIVHESVFDVVLAGVKRAYGQLRVGDPRRSDCQLGPLIDEGAFQTLRAAIDCAVAEGGELLLGGERVVRDVPSGGVYVQPAVVRCPRPLEIMARETFAPLLYVVAYSSLSEAIALNNGVRHGLSSAIFTNDLRDAEAFCGPLGSDCGIVNVNVGTAGAEIGGAFGGDKDSGGGRECGSDAWKGYMRRVTSTINSGRTMPLAQGLVFAPSS
jgi:aldehyde dehydrogenase (NAD+)